MPQKPKAAFFGDENQIDRVFKRTRARIAAETDLYPEVVTPASFEEHLPSVADTETVFTTWGFDRFELDAGRLDLLPSLKAIFYGAGSVKSFAAPLLENGVRVFSSWQANAVPVAEFCLGQIILACKNFLPNASGYTSPAFRRTPDAKSAPGLYGEKVALIGYGAIARTVVDLLRPFTVHIQVVPFLDSERTLLAEQGIEQVTVEQAFREAYVVSNQMANLPVNQKMLNAAHFASMRPNATFLNTARGAQVDEDGLIAVLRGRPDLTAILDVTHPEPPADGSALYSLPNVWLTTHIAGSMNDELTRMADFALESFRAYRDGTASPNEVTIDMLEGMA